MRAVIQRVSYGSVKILDENYFEEIKNGMVILLGIRNDDTEKDSIYLADKCSYIRIFEDENKKMNLSLSETNGEVLIISQFTLYGDARKGYRPSFTEAAKPDIAIPLYEKFISKMKQNIGDDKVKTGIFGAMMKVEIHNDGPVTIIIDSKN
ncbi:MAG: D-aminoacyl-tRNA deacylase [Melioribacteraceae bacterium]|nr:D-aminoacyl-tRNA deacylase [Melioribacteraceae bacterium]